MLLNERLLRTKRLDLVVSTLQHVKAELQKSSALGPFLGASIPGGLPPGEYDRHAVEFFQSQLQAGGSSVVGLYGWYAIPRNTQGVRGTRVAGGRVYWSSK